MTTPTIARSITTREEAYLETSTISADANGVKCIAEFLGDLDGGSISMSVPEQTKGWLRGELYDFLRQQGERIEARATAVEAFLKAERLSGGE